MLKTSRGTKRSMSGVLAGAALSLAAGSALAVTPFQADVGAAINKGLNYLATNGAFNNPSSSGAASGLAMEALLEKRASGNPADPPSGYSGALPADKALLKTAAAYILTSAPPQSFYAYRDGAWMFALSGYALTGGPDKSVLAPANPSYKTIKQTMDAIVDRALAGQTPSGPCKGFWGYSGNGCDSSTTQYASAGLNAARVFYQSVKSADDPFADPARAALIDTALANTRAGYALNGKAGSDNAACRTVTATERGIGYQAQGYNPSLQQTASGVYIQLFGGADVNDPSLQHYMEWLKNHYRYTDLDSMGNDASWAGWSHGYYLWSSFKGMELIRQSGVAVNAGNVGPNDLGTFPANAGCTFRQSNLVPGAQPQPASFGGAAAGVYNAEVAGQYFDYAYTLINMQAANGSFTGTGYQGSWEGGINTSHNSYALLVLQRATGVVQTKCDTNGDGKVDVTDIKAIMAGIGKPPVAGDPRDYNGDGVINIVDVRQCTLQCTNAKCAP